MKVRRVTINADSLEAGVVFDAAPGVTGRAIIALTSDWRDQFFVGVQAAFDSAAQDVSTDTPPAQLTTELHRLRNARQELEVVQRDHAAAIDEHGKRTADARKAAERDQMQAFAAIDAEIARRREEAATIAAGLATNLDNQRKAIAEADKELAARHADKEAVEKELAELQRITRLSAIAGITR